MNKGVILGILLLTFLGCKKGNFQNPLKKHYEISGTFYCDYNLKPVAFANLELYSENLSSGSGEPKLIQKTTTDINGIFSFNYPKKKDESTLFIRKAIGGNPSNFLAKPLLMGIPPNENYNTDVFQYPFGNVRIKLDYSGSYGLGDTLYIAGLPLETNSNFYKVNVSGTNLPGLIIPFPVINNEFGPYRTYWKPDLRELTSTTTYFGIGKQQLTASINVDTLQQQKVFIREYPSLSVLRLKLD